jgi:hypothetical protein
VGKNTHGGVNMGFPQVLRLEDYRDLKGRAKWEIAQTEGQHWFSTGLQKLEGKRLSGK